MFSYPKEASAASASAKPTETTNAIEPTAMMGTSEKETVWEMSEVDTSTHTEPTLVYLSLVPAHTSDHSSGKWSNTSTLATGYFCNDDVPKACFV